MKRHALTAGETSRAGYSSYMQRKTAELALIERFLAHPPPPPQAGHLSTLLQRKFKSAAMGRAETAAVQWSQTETKWKSGPCGSGVFRFQYEYQRADLSVEGPEAYSIRGLKEALWPTHYTASGMAAMSAAFLAIRRIWPGCAFDARADGYPETRELIFLLGDAGAFAKERVVIIDSTCDTVASARERLKGASAAVFDTSCLAASSARIRAVVGIAREAKVPLILVRSHTKLDCFGLDYGRLGSIVMVRGNDVVGPEATLDRLVADFVRLTGSAALPLHFPPFAGGEDYRCLSRARTAWTMRCTRLIGAHLRRTMRDVKTFPHGLYVVFFPAPYAQKEDASAAAATLIDQMTDAGIPARHAGSFGFDFFGCDWFEDPQNGRIGLRLSVGDLPLCLVDRALDVIDRWKVSAADTETVQSAPAMHGLLS